MIKSKAYAATSATTLLAPYTIERREPKPTDVQIEILYCGVCHSDLHTVRNEWKGTIYPCIPGHEIVGRVTKIGDKVKKFKVGDHAAVGCLVDSCRTCSNCKQHLEQYCEQTATFTYNSPDPDTGKTTYGGYSTTIVVTEDFVLTIPEKLQTTNLAGIAPLLCAGITTYSPLKHWKVSEGSKVGVVGLGGLGHMALKLAHAMGAHVTLFTTSANKTADARRLGAHEIILSSNPEQMAKHPSDFDFILDTVSAPHDLEAYLKLLHTDGTMCLVGVPPDQRPTMTINPLIRNRLQMAGSMIGGIEETQEMLNFCGEHNRVEVGVAPPPSSNRTCGFPASGFPINVASSIHPESSSCQLE